MQNFKQIILPALLGSVVVTVILGCIISFVIHYRTYDYSIGRDTYYAFGNGRFQAIKPGNELYIHDGEDEILQIGDVEKYILDDRLLFVEGYIVVGRSAAYQNGRIKSYYPDKQLHFYGSFDEIPYYTVINIDTGEAEYFLKNDQLPQQYKEIFDQTLPSKCEHQRTCFKKE